MFLLAGIFLSIVAYGQHVKWYSFAEAVELNAKEPRKIIVDVYTDWCGWCKVMDRNTFSNSIVASYLNEKYYPVKLNAEQKDSIIVGDKKFGFVAQGTRGYHELAAILLSGQMSYPSVVFLNEEIQILYVNKGYMEAKPFDELIRFIGGNHYTNQNMDEWKATYKSPVKSNPAN